MRRVVLLTVAVLGVGLAFGRAGAATAPTLTAPSSATYYSTVTLTGTTPSPGEPVEILFRAAGTSSYVVRRHLTSSSDSTFSTTYTALSTQYIAARADGVNSYVHVVHVPTAHCTTSAPAFATLPIAPYSGVRQDAAVFNATRGQTWAGTVWDGPRSSLDLITWAGSAPHVLGRYRYVERVFDETRSVRAVGFTPGYALVANVQDPALPSRDADAMPMRSYYWLHGVRHTMSHGPWSSWEATGVSDSGAVVGEVLTPAHHQYVVEWPHAGDPYQVIGLGGSPVIDGRGDIAYDDATFHAVLRTVEGRSHDLQALDTIDQWTSLQVSIGGASANAVFGIDEYSRAVRWFVHPESPDGAVAHAVVVAGPSAQAIDSVGRQNTAVVGFAHGYVRTATGAYAAMPAQHYDGPYYSNETGVNAVNMNGTVAFTAASDRRVHFLRCVTS